MAMNAQIERNCKFLLYSLSRLRMFSFFLCPGKLCTLKFDAVKKKKLSKPEVGTCSSNFEIVHSSEILKDNVSGNKKKSMM